jgi:hypothetical protein
MTLKQEVEDKKISPEELIEFIKTTYNENLSAIKTDVFAQMRYIANLLYVDISHLNYDILVKANAITYFIISKNVRWLATKLVFDKIAVQVVTVGHTLNELHENTMKDPFLNFVSRDILASKLELYK